MAAIRTAVLGAAVFTGLLLTGCAAPTSGHGAAPGAPARTAAAASRPAPAQPVVAAAPKPKPRPKPTPCDRNHRSRYVYVSIARQHLWMCARHRVAYSTAVTTGMAGPYTGTPTGSFTIQGRDRNSVLTLNTGQTYDVKYWIPFQAPLFGFHDSPWQTFPYGSPKYWTAGSHGCVHMPLKAISFLYDWADIGTTVRITSA